MWPSRPSPRAVPCRSSSIPSRPWLSGASMWGAPARNGRSIRIRSVFGSYLISELFFFTRSWILLFQKMQELAWTRFFLRIVNLWKCLIFDLSQEEDLDRIRTEWTAALEQRQKHLEEQINRVRGGGLWYLVPEPLVPGSWFLDFGSWCSGTIGTWLWWFRCHRRLEQQINRVRDSLVTVSAWFLGN